MTIKDILKKFPNTKESDWHKHSNGGGWVQNTARAEKTAYVGPEAIVYGNALVYWYARVSDNARVYGNTRVFGYANVGGNAQVFGYAIVYGNAQVYGDAQVSGFAGVSGSAQVSGFVEVSGSHRLIGGKFNKTPIYIQGTKYAIFQSSNETIGIGCMDFEIKTSKKKLMEVAKEEGFTEKEIEEYEDCWSFIKGRLKKS